MDNDKLKTISLVELARQYNVTKPTIKKWIKPFENELGLKGRLITPKQLGIIYDRLGPPENA